MVWGNLSRRKRKKTAITAHRAFSSKVLKGTDSECSSSSAKPATVPDLESHESGSVPARNKIPAVHADRGQTCAVRKLQGGLAPVLHMSTRAGVTAAQRFLQAHVQLNRANNFDGRAVAHSTKAFWMRPSEERIDILPHNVAARAHLEEYQWSGAPQDAAGQSGALKGQF